MACEDGTLGVLDVRTAEFTALARGAPPVQAVAVASDSGPVVVGFADGSVRRYDIGAGTSATVGVGPPAHAIAITPDGEMVTAAAADGVLSRWHPRSGTLPEIRTLGLPVAVVAIDETGDLCWPARTTADCGFTTSPTVPASNTSFLRMMALVKLPTRRLNCHSPILRLSLTTMCGSPSTGRKP